MGGLFSKPKAPKPVPPPDRGDGGAAAAADRTRRRQAGASTRASTKLGGSSDSKQTGKTALGG